MLPRYQSPECSPPPFPHHRRDLGRAVARPPRPGRGFSLAEVLVAIMLLGVGLLGMAGSSSLAMRTSAAAARERRAVQRAEDRIARLAAAGCAAAAAGAESDRGAAIEERWSVAAPTNGVVATEAQVRWPAAGGMRTIVLPGAVLC